MSLFNKSAQQVQKKTRTMSSHDGVKSFKPSAFQELCDRVLTCFYNNDKFYESGATSSKEILRLIKTVGSTKAGYVRLAKLAILTREKFYIRSANHVLLSELSLIPHGNDNYDSSLVRKAVSRAVIRPDEITEILSYIINNYSETYETDHGIKHRKIRLTKQMSKGLGDAFKKFDAYQLAKYKGKNKDLSLKDALKMLDVKPMDDKQAKLWRDLLNDELAPAETWENSLSKTGKIDKENKTDDQVKQEIDTNKKESWETMILSKKMGYLATLRNIRNVIAAGVSNEAYKTMADFLSNEKAVLNSKVFPLQFYTAYKALITYNVSKGKKIVSDPFKDKYADENVLETQLDVITLYKKAFNKALWYSGKNVSNIKGNTVIGIDLSGSMDTRLNDNSSMTYMEVGAVMGALAQQYAEKSIVYGFGQYAKIIKVDERGNNALNRISTILKTNVGHSTNFHLVIQDLINGKIHADQIFIFTDCQLNGNYLFGENSLTKDLIKYRNNVNPNVKVYEFNIAGQGGGSQLDPRDPLYFHYAGFSDATLKFISEYENVRNGIVDMVDAVVL